jgi:hypothetical protein
MTDDYTSSYPDDQTGSSTTDTVKEQAGTLKEKATGAGGHLLGEAKGEAAAVTDEAKRQARGLWSQARSELSGQVEAQQGRLATGLTSLGDQLNQIASTPSEQNFATDIVREVAGRADSLGRWFENHGPEDVLEEVRRFAQRRPGTFLLVAAGAGVVLGRLTRGLKDATSDDQGSVGYTSTGSTGTGYTGTTGYTGFADTTGTTTSSTYGTGPLYDTGSTYETDPTYETGATASTETLPVYADVVEERTSDDDITTPATSTGGWEQR